MRSLHGASPSTLGVTGSAQRSLADRRRAVRSHAACDRTNELLGVQAVPARPTSANPGRRHRSRVSRTSKPERTAASLKPRTCIGSKHPRSENPSSVNIAETPIETGGVALESSMHSRKRMCARGWRVRARVHGPDSFRRKRSPFLHSCGRAVVAVASHDPARLPLGATSPVAFRIPKESTTS